MNRSNKILLIAIGFLFLSFLVIVGLTIMGKRKAANPDVTNTNMQNGDQDGKLLTPAEAEAIMQKPANTEPGGEEVKPLSNEEAKEIMNVPTPVKQPAAAESSDPMTKAETSDVVPLSEEEARELMLK